MSFYEIENPMVHDTLSRHIREREISGLKVCKSCDEQEDYYFPGDFQECDTCEAPICITCDRNSHGLCQECLEAVNDEIKREEEFLFKKRSIKPGKRKAKRGNHACKKCCSGKCARV